MPTPPDANLAIEVLKALPTLLVTLFIGGLTVRVAQEQKRIAADQRDIARRKLNLELFERRLRVFDKVRSIADEAESGSLSDESWRELMSIRDEVAFLFGPAVENFIRDEIVAVLDELESVKAETAESDRPWTTTDERRRQLILALESAARGRMREVFGPYLDFSDIR